MSWNHKKKAWWELISKQMNIINEVQKRSMGQPHDKMKYGALNMH
jgi:hypothetical protein